MGDIWLAGSEIRRVHDGWNMDGGRVAVLHHITYDSLHPDGTRIITLSGVSDYLNDKGYQPHVVIDPFTGEAISLLPADVGGSALRANNRSGGILYQIEWLFTPGTVYNGVEYPQLTDTPMLGLDRVMALAASWGIPAVSPLGSGDRNPGVFFNESGHYGHFNAPSPDDHSDPVCSIGAILSRAGSVRPEPPKDDMPFSASPAGSITGYLVSRSDEKVVDIQGDPHNGAYVGMWPADGQKDQRWMICGTSTPGALKFVSLSGYALDSPHDDALWCWEAQDGNKNQDWFLRRHGYGLFTIEHAHRDNLVLTVDKGELWLRPAAFYPGTQAPVAEQMISFAKTV